MEHLERIHRLDQVTQFPLEEISNFQNYLVDRGRFDEAESVLKTWIRTNPNTNRNQLIQLDLARIQLWKGTLRTSRDTLQQILNNRTDENWSISVENWALSVWGQVEARAGNYQKAKELFEQAKSINPDNIEAVRFLDGDVNQHAQLIQDLVAKGKLSARERIRLARSCDVLDFHLYKYGVTASRLEEVMKKGRSAAKMSRRDFLGLMVPKVNNLRLGLAAAAGGALGVTIGPEAVQEIPTVETANGRFRMLYENHFIGVSPGTLAQLPKTTSMIWKETLLGIVQDPNKTVYNVDPDDLMATLNSPEPEFLKTIRERNMEVAWGDVGPSAPYQLRDAAIVGAEALIGLKLFQDASNYQLTERRTLMKVFGAIGALLLFYPMSNVAAALSESFQDTMVANRLVSGFTRRLNGLVSNFHPEFTLVYFRNALWADKLLLLAEAKRTKDQKLDIGVNIGVGHSGLEDFLRAGQDSCRSAILSYPKSFLQSTVDANGGIDNFCSIRLTKASSSSGALNAVESGRVVDQELKQQLLEALK